MRAAGDGSPEATIIIPTRRDAARLKRTLRLLEERTRDVAYQLIIFLDDPEPEVVSFVREHVAGATVLASDVNVGLPGAVNRARPHAEAPLLVVIHDDSEVCDGWLGHLVGAASEHPEAGIIGALNLRTNGLIRGAGFVVFADAVTAPIGEGAAPDDPRYLERRQVDTCAGCCILIRAAMFDAVGGYNEKFFPIGHGDVELALCARRHGWHVLLEPKAVVIHDPERGSLPRHFKAWAFARNQDRIRRDWADQLERDHEPRTGAWEADIERASERARSRVVRPTPNPPARDTTRDETEVGLLWTYVAAHGPVMEELEATVDELRQLISRQHDELMERNAVIAAWGEELETWRERAGTQ